MKIALQLYSVRDCINNGEDMLRVLGEVKKIGYDGVEFAGYQGLSAEVLRARLDEVGLKCVGCHIGTDNFTADKIDETIKFHKILGTDLIGTGGAPHDTPDGLAETCKIFKEGNEYAEKQGVKLYYHNHTGEFKKLENGVVPMDELKKAAWLEVDTYWSYYAGEDNAVLLPALKDRIVHIHLKDGNDGTPCALGEGTNDIKKVVDTAKAIGCEWLVVENDDPVPDGLSDVKRSIEYLKTVL
ncbi:MAG: sugar phosphate isomerase/epimerase [Clostridia bacterium]|nr:sugar phosphate isomerase/epimerase [Clostridia bacterium]